eukprot:4076901-Pyramimonas_sp.AAC.3
MHFWKVLSGQTSGHWPICWIICASPFAEPLPASNPDQPSNPDVCRGSRMRRMMERRRMRRRRRTRRRGRRRLIEPGGKVFPRPTLGPSPRPSLGLPRLFP